MGNSFGDRLTICTEGYDESLKTYEKYGLKCARALTGGSRGIGSMPCAALTCS
jgi:hypothetical protein